MLSISLYGAFNCALNLVINVLYIDCATSALDCGVPASNEHIAIRDQKSALGPFKISFVWIGLPPLYVT